METKQLANAFKATVQASLHGLAALEPVLGTERAALTGRDPAALEAVVEQKVALLRQLQHSVQARDRLQKAAGQQAGNDGGNALVAAIGDAELTRDWDALLTRASEIARLNDVNGQLANQGQRAARTAIGILTGRDTTEPTYSKIRGKRRAANSYARAIA